MGILVWERLKELDVYPKPREDFRVKTLRGGAITIISSVLMLILFLVELNDYLTPFETEELFVDTTRSHKLRIKLDIEFPKVSCSYLSIDAMDASGEHQSSIEHSIYKQRLDSNGVPILNVKPEKTALEPTTKTSKTAPEKERKENEEGSADTKNTTSVDSNCGSCYGAESHILKCCNTCQEVKQAYGLKGWVFPDPSKIAQCSHIAEDLKAVVNEGCQIFGEMEVNRVTGSFHIAPGKSFTINHLHVHDVQPFNSGDFNMTHKIRSLAFGEKIPGKTNPIDGMEGVSLLQSTMFQYYIKIVPLTYAKLRSGAIYSNQFSTTRHSKVVSAASGESGMPGVFFSYEISPIMVKYTEKSKSFGHFATGVCAIVGGVFTVAGLVDALITKSAKVLIGKEK